MTILGCQAEKRLIRKMLNRGKQNLRDSRADLAGGGDKVA